MCTIVAIKGLHPELPLVVAANRDEFYARAASPPRIVSEAPRVVAGVDLQAGGTWMGASERGHFVALTNQRQYLRGHDGGKASRGDVVMAALRLPDVRAIEAYVRTLDARACNPFNLFFGDASSLYVVYAHGDRAEVEIHALDDGLWVLPNDRIGSPEFPKTRRAVGLVEPHVKAPWPALSAALAAALGDHEEPPEREVPAPPSESRFDHATLRRLQALCIHTPVYGTRSATLLALTPGRVAHYLFADGPPCTAPFADMTGLLDGASS